MKPAETKEAPGPPVPSVAYRVHASDETRWRALLGDVRVRCEPASEHQELLLDSFDRRLQHAGIELTASGEAPRVHCRLGGALAGAGAFELERLPSFAWDFPAPQAQELARTLEARALEPIGLHTTNLERWAVLDEQQKTVAWIEEQLHLVRSGSTSTGAAEPARRIVLRGVRGYGTEFERLARALRDGGGVREAVGEAFDPRSLLARTAPRPGRWPGLTPRARSFEALARIARSQLDVVRSSEDGLRANRDAEYLHDTRVALRRLRSLLGQLAGILEAGEEKHLLRELRWLAGELGPARDLDTLLFECHLVEPELRVELAPLLVRLERDRKREQARIRRVLASKRMAKLRARLREAFAGRADRRPAGPKAARPFAVVLEKRLGARLRKVLARAEGLGGEAPAEDLHELRIACKKLRYLLECCRGLVPKEALSPCFTELKGLQGALGTIQDARVHAEALHGLAPGLAADAGPHGLLALGRFQERVLHRGQSARKRSNELLATFLSARSRTSFAELLARLSAPDSGA